MKVIIIIAIVLAGLFILFQIYTTMSSGKTETQAYKVIRQEDGFEIRYYPAATMAMISSSSRTYRDLGNSGFGKLAKYIFGGNSEKKQIAMTSPVHMEIGDTNSTMAFVLPAAYSQSNLPKPIDQDISIVASEPEYVAVIQFDGFATTEIINNERTLLENALKKKGLTYYGNFRYLGYNPPYQLVGRKNEVIVALNEAQLDITQTPE
jgi:hypothetical protein